MKGKSTFVVSCIFSIFVWAGCSGTISANGRQDEADAGEEDAGTASADDDGGQVEGDEVPAAEESVQEGDPGTESPPGDAPWPGDYDWQQDGEGGFELPVWDPNARWDPNPEPYIASGATGFLDGSATDATWNGNGPLSGVLAYGPTNGPYGMTSHDVENKLFFLVVGAARGLLDGPFSRARVGGADYSHRVRSARTRDGRYYFFTEPFFDHVFRRADVVEQRITTLPVGGRRVMGMVQGEDGELLVLFSGDNNLYRLDYDGNELGKLQLEMVEQINPGIFPVSMAYDDFNKRLYATQYGRQRWYIWYWSLSDGSFHGVLPIAQEGEPKRKRNECGPFEGTDLYNEMGIYFGPDDPERRFLYTTPNDTHVFFRLDLENRWVWGCSNEPDGVRFIDTGVPKNFQWGTSLTARGDIVTWVPHWNGARMLIYRRVQ